MIQLIAKIREFSQFWPNHQSLNRFAKNRQTFYPYFSDQLYIGHLQVSFLTQQAEPTSETTNCVHDNMKVTRCCSPPTFMFIELLYVNLHTLWAISRFRNYNFCLATHSSKQLKRTNTMINWFFIFKHNPWILSSLSCAATLGLYLSKSYDKNN